ncbi:MAG: hypothetical protein NT099_07850 [Candidatus Saganbacteria bacterium]|nr:hypothetical protein [Candidatus Saganbacteria bacterium]
MKKPCFWKPEAECLGFQNSYLEMNEETAPVHRGRFPKYSFVFSVLFIMLGLLLAVSASAEIVTTTLVQNNASSSMKTNFTNGLSIGYVKDGTQEVGIVSWQPDLKYGPFGMGINFNVPLGDKRPTGFQEFVFRYVEYDDAMRGLRYGVLTDITLGSGLLMDKYSTLGNASTLLNGTQLGLRGYYTFEDVMNLESLKLFGMRTYSNLYAVRLEEKVYPWLILGQSSVWDTDGTTIKKPDGTYQSFAPESGYGLDLTIPLIWDADYYLEGAKLANHGAGASTGIKWIKDYFVADFSFNVGLRYMERNFIPGYFNEGYENDPIDMVSVEARGGGPRSGYFLGLNGRALGMLGVGVGLEGYNNEPGVLNADVWANFPFDIFLAGSYKQPTFNDFRSLSFEQGAIAEGKIGYKINPKTTFITHYKRAYNRFSGTVEDSQYYEFQIAL